MRDEKLVDLEEIVERRCWRAITALAGIMLPVLADDLDAQCAFRKGRA
jgi:hypothetical protein